MNKIRALLLLTLSCGLWAVDGFAQGPNPVPVFSAPGRVLVRQRTVQDMRDYLSITNGGGGGGGVVSNSYGLTFTAGIIYTNNTIYAARVAQNLYGAGSSAAPGVVSLYVAGPTEADFWAVDYWSTVVTGTTNSTATTLAGFVPSGGRFVFTNTGTSLAIAQATRGSVTYFSTNSAGGGGGGGISLNDATNAAQTVVSNAKTNLGTFNTFTNVTPGLTNSYSALHNGALWLSPSVFGGVGNTYSGSINWLNAGQTVMNYSEGSGNSPHAKIAHFDNWGGTFGSPLSQVMLVTDGNIRLENNWGGAGITYPGYIILGNEDSMGQLVINYFGTGYPAVPMLRGRSYPLNFVTVSTDATTNRIYATASIQAYATADFTNNPDIYGSYYSYPNKWAHLGFFSLPPIPTTLEITNTMDAMPGLEVGRTETNGWNLRGNLIQELAKPVWSTTNFALDFSTYAMSMEVESAPTQTNRFYTTNRTAYSTNSAGATWVNFEQREFRLRAGAIDRYLLWPNWSCVSTGMPSVLPAGQVLRLSLQSWGVGESNITASASLGTDAAFAYDPDAVIFFSAAAISDTTQKGAVDYLAKATKAAGLWPKITAMYPLTGGNSNANALNLRGPTSNNIVYTATGVTHNANGITGDGSTGYGVSAYIASGATDYSNQHVIVYCRTTLPSPDQCRFVSVATAGGATRMGVYRSGTVVAIDGPQNANAGASSLAVSSDFRGFIGLSRLDKDNCYALSASLTNSFSVPAVNAPQTLGYGILCRNYAGTGITSHSDANLAFVSLGYGLTATELQVYRAIVNQYELLLGRNVP